MHNNRNKLSLYNLYLDLYVYKTIVDFAHFKKTSNLFSFNNINFLEISKS